MRSGEREEDFEYCYSGLKLVSRLKEMTESNNEVFSEQTRR